MIAIRVLRGGPARANAPRGRRGGAARVGGGRPNWKRLLKIAVALGLLGMIAALGSLVGLFSYYGSDPKLPNITRLDDYRPKQVTRILDRAGAPIGELGIEKRTVVPYDAIPKLLVQAVVAAEDADYFKHGGLDYHGMLRAFIENILRGRTAQGGSTITQQVVKTMLLSPERTMRRKVQEIILARELSQKLSKEDVLALYLNQIYYGHGRYGCEEAARYFFGKSVRDVNLAEAALLAGLPQSPERLSPRKHPDAAKTRQRYVLGQMAAHGFIERKVADRIAAEPIHLVREPASARGTAAEAVDAVGRFLNERLGDKPVFEAGTTVATTIDARLQELARVSIERGLEDLDGRQGFRGPSGRVTGKALDKRRAELAKAYKRGLKELGDRRGDRHARRKAARRQPQAREAVRRRRRPGRARGGRRPRPRATLHQGPQAAGGSVQARRSRAGAAGHRARAPGQGQGRRGQTADPADAGAGAAGRDGGDGPDQSGHPRAGRRL